MKSTTNLPTRKAQIREAALTLFAERGFYGTGMEDIARLVGIRASSLYNHVSSKQDLLADIMLTTMRELLAQFELAMRAEKPAEKLKQAMDRHVRYHACHPRDARIGNREINTLRKPEQDWVKELRRQYARGWQQLIEEGVREGSFHTLSPQLAAYALLEMGIGVAQWYQEEGPLSLDEIAFHYSEMALRQMGAASGVNSR